MFFEEPEQRRLCGLGQRLALADEALSTLERRDLSRVIRKEGVLEGDPRASERNRDRAPEFRVSLGGRDQHPEPAGRRGISKHVANDFLGTALIAEGVRQVVGGERR